MFFASETEVLLACATGLLLDALLGDPPWLWSRIRHPVVWMGWLIARLERATNRGARLQRRIAGACTVFFVLGPSTFLAHVVATYVAGVPLDFLWLGFLASVFFSLRGLDQAATHVARCLQAGIVEARTAVSQLVGRDPESLDESGILRATIESLAENFSDGGVAPVFWFLLGGLPGLVLYKATNTLDSMIGHHCSRYEDFGKFAARLDDVLNWIPARLSAFLLISASVFCGGASPFSGLRSALRDADRHRSCNAGWPEAALAGALGFALGGPRRYQGRWVRDVWLGGARREALLSDLIDARRLFRKACFLLFLLVVMCTTLFPLVSVS